MADYSRHSPDDDGGKRPHPAPQKVLDGDLDEFMAAELARKLRGGGPERIEDVE